MIDRYDDKEIAAVWSLENKYALWLKIEAALLQHLTGNEVASLSVNVPAILAIETETQHDVVAFIRWMEAELIKINYPQSNLIHFGLTSSDVVDTAFTMQIRECNKIIAERASQLVTTLRSLDQRDRADPRRGDFEIVGRTHGQAAERLAFSNKIKEWTNPIVWQIVRIQTLVYYGKLSGSLGDNKYIAHQDEIKILRSMDLSVGLAQGQIISRAYYASIMSEWAMLAGLIEKIALDIRLYSQSEVNEIVESAKRVGSSSMPHKNNPVGSENICGLSRLIRAYASVAMENIALWHERDISHSSNERIIFPDASILLGHMLTKIDKIANNLKIKHENIDKHLNEFGLVLDSQKEMLKLVNEGSTTRSGAHTIMSKR